MSIRDIHEKLNNLDLLKNIDFGNLNAKLMQDFE